MSKIFLVSESTAVLVSVRGSTLTSPSDKIPGFQNSLPGLNCVLQPRFIVQPNFKTLSVTSTQSFTQQWRTCYWCCKKSWQSDIFKPQKQITKFYCLFMVARWLSRNLCWTYSLRFVLILLSVTGRHNKIICPCCRALTPLENNV